MRSPSPQDTLRGDLGFERTLWAAAEKLRNNIDAAEYKHVVLGLVFLKYVSAIFEAHRERLIAAGRVIDVEDPEAYREGHVFWVPAEARWSALSARRGRPLEGRSIDEAMEAVERDNPALLGALPKVYSRSSLEAAKLGELVDIIGTIGLGAPASRSRDVLGRIYEYFLAQFASAEGPRGGQFYTPRSLVGLLVSMLGPTRGVVYDPCCGSGGMFVQSERFAREHGGAAALSFYGQESNATTFRLSRMNMAIRGLSVNLGPRHADTFLCDLHEGLLADYILANPPFNASEWGRERLGGDRRFSFGDPPAGNANFAWVQHILSHLAPTGTAGFILANGAMSSSQSGEGDIRRALIEADLVACVVALPDRLFYSTQIPVSLWIMTRDKRGAGARGRSGQTLFIDARGLGVMIDRTHRVLTDSEVARIAGAYRAFRGGPEGELAQEGYVDVPGFCRAVDQAEIGRHRFALVPGRFVGFARSERAPHDLMHLGAELRELEARVLEVADASQKALALLKAVLHG
jgi:type I restriction enzyme M protein